MACPETQAYYSDLGMVCPESQAGYTPLGDELWGIYGKLIN